MKKLFYFLSILAFGFTQAQPQKVNYQAVALTAGGQTVKNQAIKLRLSIVDSSATGTVLYSETHQPTTDGAGQFSVLLGGGTATLGTFSTISWSNGKDKFLKAEADVTGGTNYVLMGTSQIVSVPYALAAGSLKEGATITGANGSQYTLTVGASGPTWSLTNPNVNFSCGQSVIYAGESYPTVQIGLQCWMAKNLNIGVIITTTDQTNNGILEKYCYDNSPNSCSIFGGLYQWAEAMQYQNSANNNSSLSTPYSTNVRGICPAGWHLPSDEEFCTLTKFLDSSVNCGSFLFSGRNAGGKLKSTFGYWSSPNTGGATNISGFSALPGGYRNNGISINLGYSSYHWTSSEYSSNSALYRFLDYQDPRIYRHNNPKRLGFYVRCIMDSCNTTSSNAGSDQFNLADVTANLAANSPAVGETGAWSVLTGKCGNFSLVNDPNATFTKGEDSVYTLVWTITGPCGTTRDIVNLRFPTPLGHSCNQTVTYSGEIYPTIQIGTQCWMAKNLNIGKLTNSFFDQSDDCILQKYCYNNDSTNCNIYGGLYQWAEAVQYYNGASNLTLNTLTGNVKGICPTGWHLPSYSEWSILRSFLGGATLAGGGLKSTAGNWLSPNTGATNNSGFNALPSGYRDTNLSFYELGTWAHFWSTNQVSSTIAPRFDLMNVSSSFNNSQQSKRLGYSVRCLKD